MTKRRFMCLFAVLFALVFALSICFFAACKSDKSEDGDTGTEQDGGDNPGTDTDIPGGENKNTRSGDTLTGNEDIIGTWSGDVEIRAELSGTGYGGTIPAGMNAEITAESFALSFTPSDIVYDSIVYILEGLDEYVTGILADNGIAKGTEFVMFENFPVLVDDEGYFADIDGDWVKCQLPVEMNENGQLLISFSETMAFDNYDIDIKFDAVLDSGEYVAIEREDYVIDVATAEDSAYLTGTLEDGTTVTFENNKYDMDITTRNGKDYTVNGTSSEMTEAIAKWFGGEGYAEEGDQYVVIKIKVAEGETLSYTSKDGTIEKSYTNFGDGASAFDDGYFFIVYRLDFDEDGVCTSRGEYTVTAADGTETVYTVSFSGVTVRTRSVNITVDDEIVTEYVMKVGGSEQFTAAGAWSDGSEYTDLYSNSVWESSNPEVATATRANLLHRNATVKALATGTTEITVTLPSGEVGRCTLTVIDPLVSDYEGDGVTLGDGTTDATFANGSPLTVTMTQGDDGVYNDYTVSGAANEMSAEQIAAYNAVYTEDQAVEGDAYIVLEIKADAGSTVTYGGQTYTVGTDETSVTVVQKINASGTTAVVDVTITSGGVTTASFTIDFDGVAIPDLALVGTWSSEEITAGVTVLGFSVDATASVELTVLEDGTYSLVINNIHTSYDSLIDLSEHDIEMSGTWAGGNGTYTLTGEGGYSVTVVLSEDGETVQMSFSITYSFGSMDIPITVTDETLTSGPLETDGEDD